MNILYTYNTFFKYMIDGHIIARLIETTDHKDINKLKT